MMVVTRSSTRGTAFLDSSMDLVDLPLIDHASAEEFYLAYEPKELLGKGLSSIVRRCVNRQTGEEFAVKIVDRTMDKSLESCVRTEIDILREVSPHEWIIKLHEWFETSVYFFLVFELAQKGELFDQLTRAVRFSEARSRHVMIQLLCALGHLHAHRIVHRDVKPENILLDANFHVRLSDLGFAARLTDERPVLFELCGTPGYMAPETLNCAAFENAPGYGTAVDMWACGVILFTMLVGFPPFWHRKQLLMLRMIRCGNYSFSAPEWKDISETAKDFIRQLLVVDPSQRLTAEDALAHPFLHEYTITNVSEDVEAEEEGKEEEIDGDDDDEEEEREKTDHDGVKSQVLESATCLMRLRSNRQSLDKQQTSDKRQSLVKRRGRMRFAGAVKAVLASSALLGFQAVDGPLPTTRTVPDVPYNVRAVRCAVDNMAFRVYGHWVKKGDQQNRAAMFENEPKSVAIRIQSRVGSAMQSRSTSPVTAP